MERVSNLSSGLQLQRQGNAIRLQFEQAGNELASGRKADPLVAFAGDSRLLLALDHSLARIDNQSAGLSLAEGRSATTGRTLDMLRNSVDELGPRLLAATAREDMGSARIEAGKAKNHFETAIAALNVRHGGRNIFSGDATDQPATVSADTILADLQALTSGATDGSVVVSIVDQYFNRSTGGYVTSAYLGSSNDVSPIELSEGDRVHVQVRADDPTIRTVLSQLALASLVSNGEMQGRPEEQRVILLSAASGLLTAQVDILTMRASLGHADQRIDEARASQTAERTTLELERNAIVSADPFRAAANFQAMQGQLQSHYLVTSRISQLSLTTFMR